MLTQEILKYHLSYAPETGEFVWIRPRANWMKPGSVAGFTEKKGYRSIILYGKTYKLHRIVWLYVYNKWPPSDIDHINGIKADNRLCNLREATRSQNIRHSGVYKNNISGHKGVYYHARLDKWEAHIHYNKKLRYLGVYPTKEEAIAVYTAFAAAICKEFLHSSLEGGLVGADAPVMKRSRRCRNTDSK
jgi:hypothetical protein